MIDINLFFKELFIDELIKELNDLPEIIKPVYFSEDEDKINSKKDVIRNEDRFSRFKKENPSGFFLFSENKASININISGSDHEFSSISFELKSISSSELISDIFKSLVRHGPFFGFAGEWEEYIHRNCLHISFGGNYIEDWIGRRLEKYISGIYWYTLLSDEILNKHGVDLYDLSAEAISSEIIGNGSLHLLKFYEKSEDWKKNAERLDNLCNKIDGIFSRQLVDSAVKEIDSYEKYDELISCWR